MEKFVRLKPFNPKRGYKIRRYHIGGILFREDRGWYRMRDEALLAKLERLTQDPSDPDSKPLFDICSEKEAMALDDKEQVKEGRAAPKQAQAVAPRSTTVTTKDVKPAKETDVAEIEQPAMLDPDPDGEELEQRDPDEGRVKEVGRVAAKPATRRKKR